MRFIHRSKIQLELGRHLILKNNEIVKDDYMVYDNRCTTCNTPLEPGIEEQFQKKAGTCFDCTPGYNALDFSPRSLRGEFESVHLPNIKLFIKDCDPDSTLEIKLITWKNKLQIRWSFNPVTVYLRKGYIPKSVKPHILASIGTPG